MSTEMTREVTHMQPTDRMNENLRQLMKTEHYRLHCAEGWAESPYKDAVLAAVRTTLERLEAAAVQPFEAPACTVCATRRTQARVLMFPSKPQGPSAILWPAA